jgi:hypothetical protein
MFRNTIVAALLLALTVPAWSASIDDSLKELRQTFTLRGKPIPPEVFVDFGDSDMSGSNSIRVTIDLLAAMDSNLYDGGVNASPAITHPQLLSTDFAVYAGLKPGC